MTPRGLRIATTIIIIHSLLFLPASVSCAQDRPTQAEAKQAKEAADLFMKLLEETGDFSYVIDEMYAGDFIERYLQEQIRDGAESNSPSDITFACGIRYKRELLQQATIEDWWRLYIATNNFYYHLFVIFLNKSADDILNGRESDDEMLVKLIPPKLITLFNNHPVLKDFFDIDEDDKPKSIEPEDEAKSDDFEKKEKPQGDPAEKKGEPQGDPAEKKGEPQGDPAEKKGEPQGDPAEKKGEPQGDVAEKMSGPKPIKTPEEMRVVTETLQEGLRLMLEEQGDHSPRLTERAKSALEVIRLKQEGLIKPTIKVPDKKYLGLPPGTRILEAPTPIFCWLMIAEVNGKHKVVQAEFLWLDR